MGYTLRELAERLGAELHGDAGCVVHEVATLGRASPGSLTFLHNRRYLTELPSTKASAVILAPDHLSGCPANALVLENPYLGFARAAALLVRSDSIPGGRHSTAWVSEDAVVRPSAWVGPQSVIGEGARIGDRTFIGPGCLVDHGAAVGADCRLVANVTLCRGIRVGDRALLHPGVVVGADGFGIANDDGVWVKVPQTGSVEIGDDVEIGANTTIDRGALEDTVIECGVKLDNLVQIGHNVRVGAHTAIAACVAVGGSARIGERCTIGGAASIAGHLEIADDVHLTATSAVPNSIHRPGVYSSGMPVQENRDWRKNMARLRHLDALARRVKRLEQWLAELMPGKRSGSR